MARLDASLFGLSAFADARWAHPRSVPFLSLPPSPLGRTDISETAVGGFVTYFALHNFSRRIEMPTRAGGIHERAGEGVFLSSFLPLPLPACFLSVPVSRGGQFICGAWARRFFPLFKPFQGLAGYVLCPFVRPLPSWILQTPVQCP